MRVKNHQRENALVFGKIMSTYSVRKLIYMEISVKNLYVNMSLKSHVWIRTNQAWNNLVQLVA